ncbi:hypothetical protein PM082_009040 [Marasmius tenuissimus]|nr:hypothetical protein PM082_009040 [Marasmius tenuissimus]
MDTMQTGASLSLTYCYLMHIPAPQIPNTTTEFEQELQLLQGILEDEHKRKALVQMTGEDAQKWLDLLQLLAEYPDVPKALRSSIFSTMIRLSRNSGLYPKCLIIQNVEKIGKRPEGGGSFGDVWKGKIGRALVCLKVIRTFSASKIETLAKVRFRRTLVELLAGWAETEATFKQDYMQEAIVWRQLNHRNLLPFMGMFYLDDDHEQLCLVSPWMSHGNLVQFLKRTPPEQVDHQSLVSSHTLLMMDKPAH